MHQAIPEKIKGKNNDLEFSVDEDSVEAAKDTFARARFRLLNPQLWQDLCGPMASSFDIVDKDGKLCNRPARAGDYIRINIPGPGPSSGNGYDWVTIVQINESGDDNPEEESIRMTVRPSSSPHTDSEEPAHFFKSSASSTFFISRHGTKLTSCYQGRNEELNKKTDNIKDNIRNTLIGLGAMAGLSEAQWSVLIKAFLKEQD
jgi:hypothetical protein